MNRSRMVAAGTSVGALIAITAGVAAANPAPSSKPAAIRGARTAPTSRNTAPSSNQDGYSQDSGDDGWRQLPPDPSVTDPSVTDPPATDPAINGNFGNNTGNAIAPAPAFDPGTGGSGSNTSSGGS